MKGRAYATAWGGACMHAESPPTVGMLLASFAGIKGCCELFPSCLWTLSPNFSLGCRRAIEITARLLATLSAPSRRWGTCITCIS